MALLSASLLIGVLAMPAAAGDDDLDIRITTIATGLDQPRGMDIGPNGAIYVAEAGEGGTAYCYVHPFFGEVCGGPSGAITRIRNGHQARIVTGLPSIGVPGGDVSGPEDVSRRANGQLLIPIGFAGPADVIEGLGDVAFPTGWLIKASVNGSWSTVSNIAAFEAANDPDAGTPGSEGIDTNPKAVGAKPRGAFVADAGGNDVLWVSRNGATELVAVFEPRFVPFPGVPNPGIPMQSVPDSIAIGPDGAAYVGELTGFPYAPGKARIHRVTRGGHASIYARGFTNIIDLAFGPDGSLYVLEIATNGLNSGDPTGGLWRIPPGGGKPKLLLTDPLFLPGGMAIGRGGAIYVSTCAPCPNAGEVLRIKFDD